MSLDAYRRMLDSLDAELVALLARRLSIAEEIAAYKQAHGLPVLDATRERAVLDAAAKRAGAADGPSVRALYQALLSLSRTRQRSRLDAGLPSGLWGTAACGPAPARILIPLKVAEADIPPAVVGDLPRLRVDAERDVLDCVAAGQDAGIVSLSAWRDGLEAGIRTYPSDIWRVQAAWYGRVAGTIAAREEADGAMFCCQLPEGPEVLMDVLLRLAAHSLRAGPLWAAPVAGGQSLQLGIAMPDGPAAMAESLRGVVASGEAWTLVGLYRTHGAEAGHA